MNRVTLALVCVLGAACTRPNVVFPQFVQDDIVIWGIDQALEELVAENVLALPAGPVSVQATCHGGGSAAITGTKQSDDDLSLQIDLQDCSAAYYASEGLVQFSGVLGGTVTYVLPGPVYTAGELSIRADLVYRGQEAGWDVTCQVAMETVENGYSLAWRGEICGRPNTASLSHVECN